MKQDSEGDSTACAQLIGVAGLNPCLIMGDHIDLFQHFCTFLLVNAIPTKFLCQLGYFFLDFDYIVCS